MVKNFKTECRFVNKFVKPQYTKTLYRSLECHSATSGIPEPLTRTGYLFEISPELYNQLDKIRLSTGRDDLVCPWYIKNDSIPMECKIQDPEVFGEQVYLIRFFNYDFESGPLIPGTRYPISFDLKYFTSRDCSGFSVKLRSTLPFTTPDPE